MDVKQTQEFLAAVMAFCLEHDRPILRMEMVDRLGIKIEDIKKLERNGLLVPGYYNKKKEVRGTDGQLMHTQQTVYTNFKGYFPAGYEQAKAAKQEHIKSVRRARWSATSWYIRLWAWILAHVGAKKKSDEIHEYHEITKHEPVLQAPPAENK